MQPSERQVPYLLSQQDHEEIFKQIKENYLPKYLHESKDKRVFYLAGQPGSGKTTVRKFLLSNPEFQKSTLVLNTDDLSCRVSQHY